MSRILIFLSTLISLFLFAAPSQATSIVFDFDGAGGADTPTAGFGGVCSAGDFCSTTAATALVFSSGSVTLSISGLSGVAAGASTGTAARVIEDLVPGAGGIGVLSETGDGAPGSLEQINLGASSAEAVVLSFNSAIPLTAVEFNDGSHVDCGTLITNVCGTFELFAGAVSQGTFAAIDQALVGIAVASVYTIVAVSSIATGEEGFYLAGLTVIPEPATWIMMILGFGLIGLQIRRQSRIRVETA